MQTLILLLLLVVALSATIRVHASVGPGHPVARPRAVVRHRDPEVAAAAASYDPVVVWRRSAVMLHGYERPVWEEGERLRHGEDWVDAALAVRRDGSALMLRAEGRAQVDFAEVRFRDGRTQVVDFREEVLDSGMYPLFSFPEGRYVEQVRIVARAQSPRAGVSVVLRG
jgi:hypothetical protein